MRLLALGLAVMLAAPAVAAPVYRVPRTPWGAPDLQGIWTNTSVTWLQRSRAAKALAPTEAEIAAMEQGFPPSGGMGMGIDRLLMALTGQGIRETITFPLVKRN